ncbi:TPA: pyridoxine 5'-phosphate oxidase C-terminal domain-containing protein [Legionella pneumophila]
MDQFSVAAVDHFYIADNSYHVRPHKFTFYSYRLDELSDVFEYRLEEDRWHQQVLSP